jgi:hypothetical protein
VTTSATVVVIRPEHLSQIFRIKARSQRGRANEIAKHDGELPTLRARPHGRALVRPGAVGYCGCGGFVGSQHRNGIEQAATVANRADAQLLQILAGQVRQDSRVYLVVAEHLLVPI